MEILKIADLQLQTEISNAKTPEDVLCVAIENAKRLYANHGEARMKNMCWLEPVGLDSIMRRGAKVAAEENFHTHDRKANKAEAQLRMDRYEKIDVVMRSIIKSSVLQHDYLIYKRNDDNRRRFEAIKMLIEESIQSNKSGEPFSFEMFTRRRLTAYIVMGGKLTEIIENKDSYDEPEEQTKTSDQAT